MNWLTRHKLRLYIRNSLWLFPTMAAFAGLAAVSLLHRVEIAFALEAQISTELGRES